MREAAGGGIGDDAGDEVTEHDRGGDRAPGDQHSAAHRGQQVTAYGGRGPPQSRVQRP